MSQTTMTDDSTDDEQTDEQTETETQPGPTDDGAAFDAIATAQRWTEFIDRASTVLYDEGILVAEPGLGLHTHGVDPANVYKTDVLLAPDGFESFETAGLRVGMNLDRLADTVGFASGDDPVRVALDPETRKFAVEGPDFEFLVAGIDPDSIRGPGQAPDLDLPVEFAIDGGALDRAVDGANMVSDHLALGFDPDEREVVASADGDTDSVRFAWSEDDLDSLDVDGDAVDAGVESLFSSEGILDDVVGVLAGGADPATVTLGDEMPILVEQEWADGAGQSEWMAAPRISRE